MPHARKHNDFKLTVTQDTPILPEVSLIYCKQLTLGKTFYSLTKKKKREVSNTVYLIIR